MKKTLFLIMFLVCITFVNAKDFSCAATFDYPQAISHIANRTSVDIKVEYGVKPQVRIFASEALAKDVLLDFKEGKLLISVHNDAFGKFKDVEIVVTTPRLQSLKNNDSGDCDVEGFISGSVDILARGSGDFDIEKCDFESLTIDSKSSANIAIGDLKSTVLNIYSYGSGKFKMEDCKVTDYKVHTHGSCRFEMDNLSVGKMLLVSKGSGSVNISDIHAKKIDIHSVNSSRIVIEGTTKVFIPVIKGASTIDRTRLIIK